MTTSSANNSVFRGFFEKQKLSGPNFIDWYRQLRIVLSVMDKLDYLEQPIPPAPVPAQAGQQVAPEALAAHAAWVKGSKEIAGIMLMTMEPEIQLYLENFSAYEMLQELKTLFAHQADQELLQTVQNYSMHGMGKTVNELHAMRKLHEQTQPTQTAPALHVIRAGKVQKKKNKQKPHFRARGRNQRKGKYKRAYHPKPKISPSLKKKNPAKDSICHQCGETGHWKRNCPQNLAELLKNMNLSFLLLSYSFLTQAGQQVAPEALAAHAAWVKGLKEIARIMLMTMEPEIQLYLENLSAYEMLQELKTLFSQLADKELLQTVQNYSMHDMGKTGLRVSKKLKPGALSLYVGNGQREAVEAIDVFHLCLPSGLEIVLNNCHYAPSISRGVISISRLYEDDFINRFVNNTIQVSRNNMVYFSAIPRDGIFEIDLSNSYANESSIYTVSNKRAKLDLDSALLWHCRLGHISKKRIEKLQHDRLINSTDLRAFEKCVPCMSGKMARKPYTHQVERAKDLLGLIHTDDHGIIAHRTPPYTPQHNGVSERRNRTLLDMVRSMMSQTTLPKSFWDYALETVARILNMVPTKKVEKTPYEVWHGQAPKLSYLKVWGCEALVKRDTLTKPDKLEPRSIKCFFIGYPKETMGYCFYYPPENKVLVARNAEFLENSLITQEANGSPKDLEIIQEEDTHPSIDTSFNHEEDDLEIDEPQSDIIPIRRSIRTRRPTDRMCLYIDAEEHELGDLGEPANYKAALLDPESDKWLNAMNVEMQSMKDNEVWDLVDLPPNGKTVGSKWLFKKKTDMDGAVHTYKARLVAKGYTQTPGIDYEETFSPVADIRAITTSRQWNKQFDDEIKKFGFTQNRDEPCVYLKASGSNVTFLILYVDDILIMGNNIPMLQDVKSYLGRCFAMKDLGEAAYILGIKIYRDRSRRLIGLCQSAYIEKILKRYHMENSKRGSIPMQEKLRLSKSQGASTPAELKRMQNVPYASAVGSIMNTKDMFLVYGEVLYKLERVSANHFSTSSAEAEYIAAYDASKEAVWVRKFISGLGVVPIIEEPIKMYCDNTRAITIANKSEITKDARHFRAKVHYLREVIEYGDIKLEKVHTNDNLANPFTKALAFPKYSEHTKNIGMLPASSLM
ncbi:retrotransposon protein, putative, ty1-copia subclass [Tanacetum coccineum]